MTTMIICIALAALAIGIVLWPWLRKTDQDASPAVEDMSATPRGEVDDRGSFMLFGYPGKVVLTFGGVAAVSVLAVVLYVANDSKPTSPDPTNVDATGGRGSSPALADVDTMIAQLEKRLEAKPKDSEGWRMLGWSYFATQRYQQSARAFAKAAALKPDSGALQSAYGEALTKVANGKVTDQAKAAFRKALAVDPNDARALIYMALLRHQRGDSRGALNDLFRILQSQPPDSSEAEVAKELITKVAADSGITVPDWLASDVAAQSGAGASSAKLPGPTEAQAKAAQRLSPREQQAMIEGMVTRLEARLTKSPRDVDGWIMLIRSRKQMGQEDGARNALARGLESFADDQASKSKITEAARSIGLR